MAEKGRLNILLASSEVVPYAKTGGLADVAAALPKALAALGHDVRIILPKYKSVEDKKFNLSIALERLEIPVGNRQHAVSVKTAGLPKTEIPVYFIQEDSYFNREDLYRTKSGDHPDNLQRFSLFSRAILEAVKKLGWQPDVIHCNDWQTGLVPTFLKTLYAHDLFYKDIATLFTIHNMAYQGAFPKESLPWTGLGWDVFTMEKLEYWGQINLMKAGLVYADILNTVSKKYSKEIQTTNEFGRGLEGILRMRSADLFGIVNGIDYDEWSPETDTVIAPKNFSPKTLEIKKEVKKLLLEKNNLVWREGVPVIGLISRLDDQKGLDLIAGISNDLMKLDIQLVILGTGEQKYHDLFQRIKSENPGKIGLTLGFDNERAHLIYAGSDFFLMPSRFEPCGLGQLISLKYGTVPIVRETGGLADTVTEFKPQTKKGNGFSFGEYSSQALLATVKRALQVYQQSAEWNHLVQAVMQCDFSWPVSAGEYVSLYHKAMAKRRAVV